VTALAAPAITSHLACARLGKTPKVCTAIEDSREGISSATAAGLYVIGIQAPRDSLDADAVYASLTDPGLWRALAITDTAAFAARKSPA
jgi:beta-phosphoglucomutase-like phosphatase (HAD superfamily)